MSINIDINVILFIIIISIFLLLDSLNEFTITTIILSTIFVVVVSTIILCAILFLTPFIIGLLIIISIISLFKNKTKY